MKNKWIVLFILLFSTIQLFSQHNMNMTSGNKGYADSLNSGIIQKDTMKSSPHRTAMATISKTHVHISYGSPGVKGRVIWGGLVAYDQVWVAGAHSATSIEFYEDVFVGDKKIRKGKYAFFVIPTKSKWTLILNKNWNQHLADNYDEKQDLLRLIVEPIKLNKTTQRLTYLIKPLSGKKAIIEMRWENISIQLPFIVNN